MKRNVTRIAVLGSGVMGSRIACHFAHTGFEVLLLDIAPKELLESETKKGLTLESAPVRNRIVNDALQAALKSNPSPVYRKSFAQRITTGNFTDNMKDIATCDWIIEVVVERLDIKQQIFEQIEKFRKPGALITSNTSGIPMHLLTQGRSDDFIKHFCGTHFFNPPRYLRLLEIIPTPHTNPAVIDFLLHFGELHLGKTTVLCKDTPAFIANRIGVYGIMSLFHQVKSIGLTVEEVDKLTGPVLGRPKSATFRTCDVVGLDTLVHVANGLYQACPQDEAHDLFQLPEYVATMNSNKWLGDKSGQGFYKKVKNTEGKSEILALDLNTLEYRPQQKVKFATLEQTKVIDAVPARMKVLVEGTDKAGEFYRQSFAGLFAYCANRIPEISDELYKIDQAMNAGFGWELGPFEMWDAVGVHKGVELIKTAGLQLASWVEDMLKQGITSFYKRSAQGLYYYDSNKRDYVLVPGTEQFILLKNIRETKTVWKNSGTTLTDIGDGVLNLEFHTKMNTIGGEVLQGVNTAIDKAEKEFRGLVISNEGANFSAGANLGLVFMFAVEQEWDELDFAVRAFQQATSRIRYSSIPVVVAPHNLTLGGGTEICLHADAVVAHAETYMGLVEFGVGVIPGGGGTKEFALRLSDELMEGDVELNAFRKRFLTIGQAQVSTSAYEAFDLGYLREGVDEVVYSRDRLLLRAKEKAIELADAGYVQPLQRKDIRVLGKQALGLAYVGANSMESGKFISAHDSLISRKLAWVLCGGDLSQPTLVNEKYLLDLEREAFLSLCGERKSLERMQSILQGGKVLRN
ncbi:MAG: 3-hydroxyacyl-CoA dehydrogenase/enoyl-CoA hydratase family protein [Bacteroidetes bacterium]|nr:3-hydroxyacyl-CoA dehydrogenase/enoyl-CoA hydratase family protein [Bacteroidota bacterium]